MKVDSLTGVKISLTVHCIILIFLLLWFMKDRLFSKPQFDAIPIDMIVESSDVIEKFSVKDEISKPEIIEKKDNIPEKIKEEIPVKPNTTVKQEPKPKVIQRSNKIIERKEDKPKQLSYEEIKKFLSGQGETHTSEKIDLDLMYINQIRKAFYSAWEQPGLDSAGLSAKAEIVFNSVGYITGKRIIQSSGDKFFDISVEKALDRVNYIPGLSIDFIRRNPVVVIVFKVKE